MLPDPVELMEMRMEELIEEQCGGLPADSIRCWNCQAVVPIDSVVTLNQRPDAPAICQECASKHFAF